MTKYLLILMTLGLAACTVIQEIRQQVETIEDTTVISGKVSNRSGRNGPLIAALLKSDGDSADKINGYRLVSDYQVSGDGSFKFFAKPGIYTVSAFVDNNSDGVFNDGEAGTYLGESQGLPINFVVKKNRNKKLRDLVIKQSLQQPYSARIVDDMHKALKNIGRVVRINDPMFSSSNAKMGQYQPVSFLEEVGGGMFLLGKYRKGRIPVVFVHGMNGTPKDWKYVIRSLDKKKFQPVVLHYASGLPLDMVSEYMLKAINKLRNKYRFEEFYIAAHSMGGLVTRSFVKKYVAGANPARIGMVMTINSPMMGMESAVIGVKYMPIVVPAWRDVAFGSAFIKALNKWPWPRDIPYHLVFSYLDDEAGDGVASLQSQIPRSLQREASGMYGFNAEHAGLLRKRYFTREFNGILRQNLLKKDGLEIAASG